MESNFPDKKKQISKLIFLSTKLERKLVTSNMKIMWDKTVFIGVQKL